MGDARLRADCARCFGLCCVAPAFVASADFAATKPAGTPCANLGDGFRCDIHADLRGHGFPGCVVYDCFGAGQQVAQVTYDGRDWRAAPHTAGQMFAVFAVMRDLHELLYYATEALGLDAAAPVHGDLRAAVEELDRLTAAPPEALLAVDVGERRAAVNPLLSRASELARSAVPSRRRDHRGASLVGARLAGQDLRGANLRGAVLVGADLRRADLRLADVTGADLRGADLRGANVSDALFLVQSQLTSARGDARTVLPAALARPAHWRA
ncbi:pentapeptide repeat-containing protein [Luedemannella helvata]|uniref:Pentapeptide repeat-containing protein n=1 Tax=Luedemannella helvata TaxID=349315 RepID=A0ABN2KAG6_9ACTN